MLYILVIQQRRFKITFLNFLVIHDIHTLTRSGVIFMILDDDALLGQDDPSLIKVWIDIAIQYPFLKLDCHMEKSLQLDLIFELWINSLSHGWLQHTTDIVRASSIYNGSTETITTKINIGRALVCERHSCNVQTTIWDCSILLGCQIVKVIGTFLYTKW